MGRFGLWILELLCLAAGNFEVNSLTEMRLPPSARSRGNLVNFSMLLSDLKDFDETNERLTVYALMTIRWQDLRWLNASKRLVEKKCNETNCTEDELLIAHALAADELEGYVFGQTAAAFFEASRAYGQQLGLVVSGNAWTPIPADLFLKTSENPLGKTDFDPVIYMPRPEVLTAVWVDRRKTHFDVSLSYEHFPFDEQVLDLCVNFDYFSVPSFVPWRNDDPAPIEALSERWDAAATLSDLVSKKFIAAFEGKGFSVVSIRIVDYNRALNGSRICVEIVVARLITILLLRFFLPLSFLLFIPFAGFFIPIEMVMPRVATGFISFLSLQVFRTMAYSLIPKPSSSLLWMDVAMFSVTVIMFASLLENVLAQAIRATVSSQAARFVDNLSRVTFPLMALLILLLLFSLGAARVPPGTNMAICLVLLSIWLLSFSVAVMLYPRTLPQRLMKILVKLVSQQDSRYHVPALDQKELFMVFKVFDSDGRGYISADKVFQRLQSHGLSFAAAQQQRFQARLRDTFQRSGEVMDLKAFCQHFGELFQYEPVEEDDPGARSDAGAATGKTVETAEMVDVDGDGEATHPFEVLAT